MDLDIEKRIKIKFGKPDQLKEDMVWEKKLKEKYVSDGIKDEYTKWTYEDPVLISSQTGSGKNHFSEEKILPYAKNCGKGIWIISNRIANNHQSKRRIAKRLEKEKMLEYLTDIGLDKTQAFGYVTILSYQKLLEMIESLDVIEAKKITKDIGFVVFDEAHFFVSDSTFNPKTEHILHRCVELFCKAIRIYMTATPDEVFPEIINVEKEICSKQYTVNCMADSFFAVFRRRKFYYYNFKRNYKYISSTKYFENEDELIKAIKNDKTDQKWLVFVNSKKRGQEMCRELGDMAVFIDASSKESLGRDGDIYRELVENEQFSCKVLIATSVVDNGINIKDSALTNIVPLTYDKTEFIQMLGRKRIGEGENITLYICSRSSKEFSGKIHQVNQTIAAICTYKKDKRKFKKNYYEGSSENFQIVRGIFYFDKRQELHINGLAERKSYRDKEFYENIKEKLDSGVKEAFVLEQLSWLGLKKTYNEQNWLNFNSALDQKEEFNRFLEQHINITISGSNKEEFYNSFKALYTRAFGRRKNDRPDRNYGDTVIRSIFKELSLNYGLKCSKESVTLVRT